MATTTNTNKLRTAFDTFCGYFFECPITEAVNEIIESPHFNEEDMVDFIRYAVDCNRIGAIPTFKEWFAIIAPSKTGSSSH